MQLFEKVAEALSVFPACVWNEPAQRSWSPGRQVECIDEFKYELERLQKLITATSALIECGYPLAEIFSSSGALIWIEQRVPNDPTLAFTINASLLENVKQYMVLNPDVEHDVGIEILCIMEATSEYLTDRIAEELKFLDYITEKIGIKTKNKEN